MKDILTETNRQHMRALARSKRYQHNVDQGSAIYALKQIREILGFDLAGAAEYLYYYEATDVHN